MNWPSIRAGNRPVAADPEYRVFSTLRGTAGRVHVARERGTNGRTAAVVGGEEEQGCSFNTRLGKVL